MSDLWPLVRKEFEERLPFKRALLNNKTRNAVLVDEFHAEYVLTTDSRLRSRFPQEQSLFWFREPYATLVLVSCEVQLNLGIFLHSFSSRHAHSDFTFSLCVLYVCGITWVMQHLLWKSVGDEFRYPWIYFFLLFDGTLRAIFAYSPPAPRSLPFWFLI